MRPLALSPRDIQLAELLGTPALRERPAGAFADKSCTNPFARPCATETIVTESTPPIAKGTQRLGTNLASGSADRAPTYTATPSRRRQTGMKVAGKSEDPVFFAGGHVGLADIGVRLARLTSELAARFSSQELDAAGQGRLGFLPARPPHHFNSITSPIPSLRDHVVADVVSSVEWLASWHRKSGERTTN